MRLLIINGWSASKLLWRPFIENLPAVTDVKIIDIDRSLSLESWRNLIDSQVDNQTLLMGWSLGGMLAVDYAATTEKQLPGLCVLQTNPSFIVRQGWLNAMSIDKFEQFYALIKTGSRSDLIRQFSHMLVTGSDARKAEKKQLSRLYSEQMLPDFDVLRNGLDLLRDLDLRASLPKLRVPSIFLYGKGDALVPVKVAQDVQLLVPRHIVKVISGMGHLPCLAYQSEIRFQLERLMTSNLWEDNDT